MAHTHTDILITILKTSAHTLFSHPMIEGLGTGDWGLGIGDWGLREWGLELVLFIRLFGILTAIMSFWM